MKILLVACNAKYIHSNLAVYDLRAYARDYRQHILLKEYTINQLQEEIMKDLYLEQPDVVCFSCYIWNITFVRELAADLAKVLPGVPFWAGGPEVSFDPQKFLQKNPAFFGVMMGEGEATFLDLVRHYVEGAPALSQMAGITYREGEDIKDNGWREPLDLSRVPFPYSDLEDFQNRIIYYESSRGCPFSCSYCLSSVDKHLRFRDLTLVLRELQFFIDRKVPQVKFVDRTFNCRHAHAMAIWTYLAEHDNGITNFHFEISADLLREEELALMQTMRPGLIQLEIGVQSTNPQTIQSIRRKMDLKRLARVVQTIHGFHNIHQHLDLIAGLPYEDYASFRQSFNEVYALRPQQLQLGFLKVLKGSYMKDCVQEYGIIHKELAPYEIISTRWLPYSDVLRLKMVENMVEMYYNSSQFRNTLLYLESLFEDSFSLYEALGLFYHRKGYETISHTRIRKYEILLEFVRECTSGDPQCAADRLMLDLYLREKLKSRPGFAPDQSRWEKAIWEARRRGHVPKTAHVEVFRDGRVLLFDYQSRDPLTGDARTENFQIESVINKEEKSHGDV